MPDLSLPRQRVAALVAALLLVVWCALGLYQGLHRGFSGGLYDPAYRVREVPPGSVAARSGFQPGDRVLAVEGIPVERLGMESRWPRSLAPRAGESRRFLVERGLAHVTLDVVFPAPFPAAVNTRLSMALLALAFLSAGLWAFLTVSTPPARLLAATGLCLGAGAAFGLGPHLGLPPGVQGHAGTAAEVLFSLLLLRFFTAFPAPKNIVRPLWWLAHAAWAGLLLFLAAELVLHPALYYTTGSVAGPLMLGFGLLALLAAAHTALRTPRAELRASGMHWILAALGFCVLGSASLLALPLRVPGWAYALLLATLPCAMAAAVRRQAGSSAPAAR